MRLKKSKTLGRGGCVFGSSPKRLEWPHPQLVHWWLLVRSSQNKTLYESRECYKEKCKLVTKIPDFESLFQYFAIT
jgi:hypothetical protein